MEGLESFAKTEAKVRSAGFDCQSAMNLPR
jgi:hypothetical protein